MKIKLDKKEVTHACYDYLVHKRLIKRDAVYKTCTLYYDSKGSLEAIEVGVEEKIK